MIHVALFSFQRTTLFFISRSSCFKRLIYCTASLLDCQELFYFSFLSERQPIASCKLFPLKEPCLAFHAGRYLAATCIILQDGGAFVNTYFSKSASFFEPLPCSRYKAIKNASIARCVIMAIGGGTEI